MDVSLVKKAARITAPIFFGYISIGIPFGVLVVKAGYCWWLAPLMGLVMYAGAGQYVAIGLFAARVPLGEILVAEFFVNIRHLVYGLSLISKFKDAGRWKPYLVYALTDETYALQSSLDVPPGVRAGTFYGLIALLDHCYWVLGSTAGALLCGILLHYNLSQWLAGVDFALTALFVVILVEQVRKSRDVLPPLLGIVTAVAAVALSRAGVLPANNIILVAIVLGVSVLVGVRGRRLALDVVRQGRGR